MTADSDVEDMLCLSLHAATRAMTSCYRRLLEPFGLTYPQYLLLLVLAQQGRTNMITVGRRMRLDSSTLSPLVRRLEGMGLVSRTRSSRDERHVELELTSAGQALHGAVAIIPEQISAATGFSVQTQEALTHTLHELEANLRRTDAGSDSSASTLSSSGTSR